MNPVKYEDLDKAIKDSLGRGHVLAEHTVIDVHTKLTSSHLTTVQLSVAYDPVGRGLAYCNDVCEELCMPGSVRLVQVEWPPVGDPQVVTSDELTMEVNIGRMQMEFGVKQESDLPSLRLLREAHQRLEELRKWTFARYRIAVHNDQKDLVRLHAITLFFVITGLKPGDDPEAFGGFMEHLLDAVIMDDAEDLPEFSAETGEPVADCG